MTNNDKVITRIKKVREEKNIKQAAIAQGLGITPAAYNKLENGHTQLTVNNLYLIAEILDVPANTFLEANNHNTFNIKTNILGPNTGTLNITLDKSQLTLLKKLIDENTKE